MSIISVDSVCKSYGKVKALESLSLTVEEGELYGLIGADGAGKTTLFRILATLLLPNSGRATVCGLDTVKDYVALRRCVGYMPGRFSLYGDLTVEENLQFFASVFGTTVDKNRYLVNDIYRQIEPFAGRRAAKLSGGMKQKLALCCALIHAPRMLFLDEPTTGVDPVSRRELWQMLHGLQGQGITIVVSTPYMDEARQCSRMAFMREGVLMKSGTPQEITASIGLNLYAVRALPMHPLLDTVRRYAGVEGCYAFGDTHHFAMREPLDCGAFTAYLQAQGYRDIGVDKIAPTLEDCYMQLSTL